MPRTKIEIDLKKVEEYAQVCDNEEEIALALGISYSTLRRRKRDYEQFEQSIKKGKAKANAFVGGKLMQLVKEGNPAAIIFYMKSRCGWRETVRQEITGAEGGSIKIDNNPDLDDVSLDDLKKARALLYEKKSTPSDTD